MCKCAVYKCVESYATLRRRAAESGARASTAICFLSLRMSQTYGTPPFPIISCSIMQNHTSVWIISSKPFFRDSEIPVCSQPRRQEVSDKQKTRSVLLFKQRRETWADNEAAAAAAVGWKFHSSGCRRSCLLRRVHLFCILRHHRYSSLFLCICVCV